MYIYLYEFLAQEHVNKARSGFLDQHFVTCKQFSPQPIAKDDSPYTAVCQKEKEDPQNGTDMHLSPMTSEQ